MRLTNLFDQEYQKPTPEAGDIFELELDDDTVIETTIAEVDAEGNVGLYLDETAINMIEQAGMLTEHIVKVKGGYELKSKHGNKNLGKYPTKAGAEKRERQVQYFKHANEAAPFPVKMAAGAAMGALSGTGGVILGGMLGGIFAPILGGYSGWHGAKLGMQAADDIWDWAAKKLGGGHNEQDFAFAHIRAAAAGQDNFEYRGKTYPVTLKKNQVQPAIQAVKQVAESRIAEAANYSPMARDSMQADTIRSLKNLIAIAKEQGRQLRVQELELELEKLQGVTEGADERSQNRLWAQITDYEKRAKATSNDIKKQHLLKMANELRGKLKTNVDEGVNNVGVRIKALYKKIYRAGDDEIEYFYNDSPVFAQYWDEYEGDLNSIIAEVDPAELQVILDELESYVDQANLAEDQSQEFMTALQGLKTWQVVIMNNYYRGKYTDYSGRYYYVLATSPEQAREVVLQNRDAILQDLLSMKSHNGKKILPRSSAVPIKDERITNIKDGTEHGRMSTAGYKTMFGPNGPVRVKLEAGRVVDIEGEDLDEAKYHGKEVSLGKPVRGGPKKFYVYVRDPATKNIKKVNFGDPNMRIKKNSPKHRKSFRARHNCANPGPRTKARYWSCRKW